MTSETFDPTGPGISHNRSGSHEFLIEADLGARAEEMRTASLSPGFVAHVNALVIVSSLSVADVRNSARRFCLIRLTHWNFSELGYRRTGSRGS